MTDCALCGAPAPDLDCGWSPCPRFCRRCTQGMRRLPRRPEGFEVDVLRCGRCGRTTVAHQGLRVPCETCVPVEWITYGGWLSRGSPSSAARRWDEMDQRLSAVGYRYVGRRVHVKPKKAPPSRSWVQHAACGRFMPKLTPFPKAPRCPWCEDLPDRSIAAVGHLPGYLYLLRWNWGGQEFLKVGIGAADGPRIASQTRHGAQVVEVREATLATCREAERAMLNALDAWRFKPSLPLPLAGDTECLSVDAPVGGLRRWFEGQPSVGVTRRHR